VTTWQRLSAGEDVHGPIADLIRADMDRWANVARRELAMERVRRAGFPHCPSRMACLYASRTLEEARQWAEFFAGLGREVYSVVRLRVDGRIFTADACNCFDGTGDEARDDALALRYWQCAPGSDRPVMETLIDGVITVDEIVDKLR